MNDYSDFTREELIEELIKRDERIAHLENQKENDARHTSPYYQNANSPLDLGSIKRYSRQLILPEIGPSGQKKLRNSSVLIVGCGGLGCPSAIYLAAAGIGRIGLVDYDEVEISNLHRQILHTEDRIGTPKTKSIMKSILDINRRIICEPYTLTLSSHNIINIVQNYDIVLDCTDNVATRYLLNDACVLSKKILVSGSALRFDGQLTVYGFEDGPCYRCLFPKPPPQETVTNCSDGGVLGVVPGIIGCLQALETIKIIVGIGDVCSKRLILLDAISLSIRSVKLRSRQPSCRLCGANPTIKTLIDYEQFCGGRATDKDEGIKILSPEKRISTTKYKEMVDEKIPHILIDVRNPVELEISSLPSTVNIPLRDLDKNDTLKKIERLTEDSKSEMVVCICRRGNDSQIAVSTIEKYVRHIPVVDVVGGLNSWAKNIDPKFPVY